MNILYAANMRMPTERAHGAQVAHMCAAFAKKGAAVTLAVPKRGNHIQEDVYTYYALPRAFTTEYHAILDTVGWGRLGFVFESLLFGFQVLRRVRTQKPDVVYGRDELVLVLLALFSSVPFVWETHTGAWGMVARFVAARAKRVVVISKGLKVWYEERGIDEAKLCVAHDGIDVEAFAQPEEKHAARLRLGIPEGKSVVLYIGSLGGWKGTDTFCEAAALSPEVHFAIIGGTAEQIIQHKVRYPQVQFLGARPYREVADNQAAADVLVLPNTAMDRVSAYFTSPLKLFTYLAAGKPIVAADIPSIREVVDERAVTFFAPDSAEALAEGVVRALKDPGKGMVAQEVAAGYSWEARAAHILTCLKK